MKQIKKGFVEIPTTTLNALKNMLFNEEGGIDLSNIINDINPNADSRDLTAINVALAYKGVHVSIDERPRYNHEWKNRFWRYDYTGYSLILGLVKMRKTLCEMNENGDIKEISVSENTECFDLALWNDFTTDMSDIYAEIEKRTK